MKHKKDVLLIGSLFLFLFIMSINIVFAFNFPSNDNTVKTTIYTSNISNFTELQDVPGTYLGQANKCVMVAGAETGLIFADCGGAGVYVPYSGATGTVNLNGQALTNVGSLILAGLATTQNLVPTTDNLYSLGNSTNKYQNIYGYNIYGEKINSTNITSSYLNSNSIDSQVVATGNANVSSNLTIGGFKINNQGGNLLITLT